MSTVPPATSSVKMKVDVSSKSQDGIVTAPKLVVAIESLRYCPRGAFRSRYCGCARPMLRRLRTPQSRCRCGRRSSAPARAAWTEAEAATFGGPIEADETYMGGKRKNRSNAKRKQLANTGRGPVGGQDYRCRTEGQGYQARPGEGGGVHGQGHSPGLRYRERRPARHPCTPMMRRPTKACQYAS